MKSVEKWWFWGIDFEAVGPMWSNIYGFYKRNRRIGLRNGKDPELLQLEQIILINQLTQTTTTTTKSEVFSLNFPIMGLDPR